MVKNIIRGGICHVIHRCATANDKYMKDYDQNEKLWYLMYWYANNLYRWAVLQKLPLENFKWEEIHRSLMRDL